MTRAWLPWPSTTRREHPRRGSTDERADPFPVAAARQLGDSQLRTNLAKATTTIRARRERIIADTPDWDDLRHAGAAIKERVVRHLDHYLLQAEAAVQAAGGEVHWACDAEEANAIVAALTKAAGADEVVKAKSLATDEIGLDEALAAAGITAYETDLAELIVQLGDDAPSHILVPAIHKNRAEIRELFLAKMAEVDPSLSDRPADLVVAARRYLREKFLHAKVGVTGANFLVAETGTIVVVESEGNARMCLTLPEVLISVVGIEKVVPTWTDLEVMFQLLPRSSTAERMNPYTSCWTGVTAGDGPRQFHLVLVDNGRTQVLADEVGRQALRCIRCSACLNVCPVYERVGGHAYGSVYPGPIGAILTPLMQGADRAPSLPYASSLCGACYEACPVEIDIPEVLVHLRAKVVDAARGGRLPSGEQLAMRSLAWVFDDPKRLARAQRVGGVAGGAGIGLAAHLPGPLAAWAGTRDIPPMPAETFRQWWARTGGGDA